MALAFIMFYSACALFIGIMYSWFKYDVPELIIIFSIGILFMGIFSDYQHSGWYLIKCLIQ